MSRPRRNTSAEDGDARDAYALDRKKRQLRVLPVVKKRQQNQEKEWAARSGPVTVRCQGCEDAPLGQHSHGRTSRKGQA